MNILLEYSINKLLDKTSTINTLFFKSLLVKEYKLILLPEILGLTLHVSIKKLITPSNSDNKIRINILLQKQRPIMKQLITLNQVLKLNQP